MEQKQSPELSDEQLKEFRASFDLFDKDGDGQVSKDELRISMRAMGHNPTENELDEMMDEVDVNRSGTIDYDEFVQMMIQRTQEVDEEQDLKRAFQVFDKNGDGFINAYELKYVVTNLGEKMTDGEVEDMLNEADTDGDGQLDYNEFVLMMQMK